MKTHRMFLCFVLTLIVANLSTRAHAQDLPSFYTPDELGFGFELVQNEQEIANPLNTYQVWQSADGAGEIRLTFGVYPSDDALTSRWRLLGRSNLPGSVEFSGGGEFGDVYAGDNLGHFRFLRNHVILSFVFIPGENWSMEETEEFLKRIWKLSVEKSLALDSTSIPNFDVDLYVAASNGVSPTLYALTEVNTFAPIVLSYRLYDLDASELLLDEVEALDTGTFEYTPDLDSSGRYRISAELYDQLGRSKTLNYEFEIGESGGEEVTLAAKYDNFLLDRNLHQNEGANPLLTLEKIQGKATRSAVAFELADTNLSGLSRATLFLTIDPSQAVNGWGNGRTISAQAITTPWQEGNGWSFGLKKKDQIAGNGSGATWFSPADQDISNDSANSAVNWDGATSSVYPPTAPSVQIVNFQSGEVAFDVTTDVLNGAENGWLVLKDQENVGSKVSFYSREGAAAAGNPDLAPRLILEFGDPVASAAIPADSFLTKTGLDSISTKFRVTQNGGELRSVREILQDSPVAALATEQLLSEATRTNPVLNLTARTAYRSWLAEDLRIAAVPVRFV